MRLTHSHLLSGEPPPVCSGLQTQQFMLDCSHFTVKRAKYSSVTSLKDLHYPICARVIVDFIKDIKLYNHL